MKFILGKKLSMTQRFANSGEVVPVTVVAAGPSTVVQVKTADRDGYMAVQLGFGQSKKIGKSRAGQVKDLPQHPVLREFRVEAESDLKRGDTVTAGVFQPGDMVQVTGTSKGKGFQGVVTRHGFSGSRATHGNKDQLRRSGSIGATNPQHVFKGMRMAGHMGNARTTVHNLEVIEVDTTNNLLYLRGAVPGPRGNLVLLSAEGEMTLAAPAEEKKPEPVTTDGQPEVKPAEDKKEEKK